VVPSFKELVPLLFPAKLEYREEFCALMLIRIEEKTIENTICFMKTGFILLKK
jgi:hypothetical protein